MFPVEKALEITEGYGTWECAFFRERIFQSHEFLAVPLAWHYRKIADAEGYVAANQRLLQLHQQLILGPAFQGLYIDSSDEDVRRFADQKTKEIKKSFFVRQRMSRSFSKALDYVKRQLARCDFEFPLPACNSPPSDEALGAALGRCFDPQWWRRQIRERQDHILEAVCIEIGLVNRKMGIYASDHCVRRKSEQWHRNETLLQCLEAINDLGEVFPLSEIAKCGPSNLVNRRNELMVRISGFDQLSQERGEVGTFITLTAPSKYHAYHANPCRPNSRYGGFTPKETQFYFNQLWQRIRAKLKRLGVLYYGFRVVEPHHDGTPHWHLLLFVDPEQENALISTIQEYALQEDPDETGADKHRCRVERIDPEKGNAVSYVAKYIAKNVDGEHVGADLYGHDAITSAERIRAWASTWNIRQFQQLGGPSVTAWRESRRLAQENLAEALSEKLVTDLINAADNGDWAEFVTLSGGPTALRKDQPLRAWHVNKPEPNKYGEVIKQIKGLLVNGIRPIRTRLRTWTIGLADRAPAIGACTGDFSTGGANAPPLEFCQ